MMRLQWFYNLSIPAKITTFLVGSVTSVVGLITLLLMILHIRGQFEETKSRMNLQANIIATNTKAALLFQDNSFAQRILRALEKDPAILQARIFDADFEPFASFIRMPSSQNIPPISKGGSTGDLTWPGLFKSLSSNRFYVQVQIKKDTEILGKVVIASNMESLRNSVLRDFFIFLISTCLALILAYILALIIRPIISEPLRELSQAALKIGDGEFDFLAVHTHQDEIGHLASAFNQMSRSLLESRQILEFSSRFNQSIVNEIPSALAVLDEESTILSVNPTFRSLFPDQPAIGSTLQKFIPGDYFDEILTEAITTQKHPDNFEMRLPGKNKVFLKIRVTPFSETKIPHEAPELRDDGDAFVEREARCLVIMDDISREKKLLHDQEESLENLKKTQTRLIQTGKMTAVGELAAGVAHEMNNPLTAVLMNAEILVSEFHENPAKMKEEELLDLLELILEGGKRFKTIVSNLLRFSRQSPFELEISSMEKLIRQTLDLIGTILRHQRISIELEICENLPLIYCNPNQIQQVFTNIIMNSAQAMDDGGKLKISINSTDDWIIIGFQDQGPGIPPDLMERVFEPFFTTKGVGKGTGLGLYIAYGIVEQHQGRILIHPRPEQGTEIEVHLPRKRESRDPSEES